MRMTTSNSCLFRSQARLSIDNQSTSTKSGGRSLTYRLLHECLLSCFSLDGIVNYGHHTFAKLGLMHKFIKYIADIELKTVLSSRS